MKSLLTPFPYHGAKNRHAPDVWDRLGADSQVYAEPFAGSLGVLLGRPDTTTLLHEIINDKDGHVANFWRAVKEVPREVAHYADRPATDQDIRARIQHLQRWSHRNNDAINIDPEYYSAQAAGYWVYLKASVVAHRITYSRPSAFYGGIHRRDINIAAWMELLATRLRHVKVLAGDWSAAVTPSMLQVARMKPPFAVFLDPPYVTHERNNTLYKSDLEGDSDQVAAEAYRWAIEHGDNPDYRIAYCCHAGDFVIPEDWTCEEYSIAGIQREDRRHRTDLIMFSPHCIDPSPALFDE